jgi:hypothetical protein
MILEANKEDLFEQVQNNLPKTNNYEDNLYVKGLSIEIMEKILNKLTGTTINIGEDSGFNGWEMDWSHDNITIKDKIYSIWGSGYSGSLCFKLEKQCNF